MTILPHAPTRGNPGPIDVRTYSDKSPIPPRRRTLADILADPTLSNGAKLLARYLDGCCLAPGKWAAWPKVSTIASALGWDGDPRAFRKRVERASRELVKSGDVARPRLGELVDWYDADGARKGFAWPKGLRRNLCRSAAICVLGWKLAEAEAGLPSLTACDIPVASSQTSPPAFTPPNVACDPPKMSHGNATKMSHPQNIRTSNEQSEKTTDRVGEVEGSGGVVVVVSHASLPGEPEAPRATPKPPAATPEPPVMPITPPAPPPPPLLLAIVAMIAAELPGDDQADDRAALEEAVAGWLTRPRPDWIAGAIRVAIDARRKGKLRTTLADYAAGVLDRCEQEGHPPRVARPAARAADPDRSGTYSTAPAPPPQNQPLPEAAAANKAEAARGREEGHWNGVIDALPEPEKAALLAEAATEAARDPDFAALIPPLKKMAIRQAARDLLKRRQPA